VLFEILNQFNVLIILANELEDGEEKNKIIALLKN
jgi:hypothetical protein